MASTKNAFEPTYAGYKAYSPDKAEVRGDYLTPFVKHLLTMDKCIMLYEKIPDDDKFFVMRDDCIFLPGAGFPSFQHELAHAVEMTNQKRWTMSDWGLALFDKKRSANFFFASLAREVRVRAIECVIINKQYDDKLAPARYNIMSNFFWHDYAKANLPFGRFKSMQDVQDWTNDLRDKTFAKWSQDRVEYEWNIRIQYIKNYMATNKQSKVKAA